MSAETEAEILSTEDLPTENSHPQNVSPDSDSPHDTEDQARDQAILPLISSSPPPIITQCPVAVSHRQPVVVHRITCLDTIARPNNYLAFSIFNVFCCCWCLGLIALYYSLRVNTEYSAGRLQEAIAASKTAKAFNYASLAIGAMLAVFLVVTTAIQTLYSQQ